MMLLTLFISVTELRARLSEELHCCRPTAHCLVPSLRTYTVSVYLKHGRLRFHKDPDSARAFLRGAHKFMSHETALNSGLDWRGCAKLKDAEKNKTTTTENNSRHLWSSLAKQLIKPTHNKLYEITKYN